MDKKSKFNFDPERLVRKSKQDLVSLEIDHRSSLQAFEQFWEEQAKQEEYEKQKKERYQLDVLNTLKNIEANTAYLQEMRDLLVENREFQQEILEIHTGILELAASPNEETAKTKYRQLLDKARNFTGDVETMGKLMKYVTDTYQMFS
ncbi:hypothetical protein [Thalassobacillus sp. C254]|uniref:hypothetical protein n=1 Tax=Thalassobacillus sp. C254 TaxID=1225341 RepID=UPI0006CF4F28|nr:hypothetical protein [Thalassobacillus sp. C254]